MVWVVFYYIFFQLGTDLVGLWYWYWEQIRLGFVWAAEQGADYWLLVYFITLFIVSFSTIGVFWAIALGIIILILLQREGLLQGWLRDVVVGIEVIYAEIVFIILNFDHWWNVQLPKDLDEIGKTIREVFDDFVYKEERNKARIGEERKGRN